MARTVLPIVGAVVGAYFGSPQIGYAIGAVIGNAVDPLKVQGPKIGETGAQTTAEGVPRAIIYGTICCTGNVIVSGPLVITEVETQEGKGGGPVTTSERCFRTYAVRICEGPIGGILRIWEDEKLVYDRRSGSSMTLESEKWAANTIIYLGDEEQLPDPELTVIQPDMPAYRGTAYIRFHATDLTDRRGSIPQYRFEVAKEIDSSIGNLTHSTVITTYGTSPVQYYPVQLYRSGTGSAAVGTSYEQLNVATGTPYSELMLNDDCTVASTIVINVNGPWDQDPPTVGYFFQRAYRDGYMVSMDGTIGGGHGNCLLSANGALIATLKPDVSFSDTWWADFGIGTSWFNDGRRIWFSDTRVYIGTASRGGSNPNNLCTWTLGGGFPRYATKIVNSVCATPGNQFFTHFGNDERMRVINDVADYSVYDDELNLLSTETLPFSLTNFHGFGVDGNIACFVYAGGTPHVDFRNVSDWSLITTVNDSRFGVLNSNNTRCIFTASSLFIQCQRDILRFEYNAGDGAPILLSAIVADIADRCGLEPSQYDVSELTDEVAGLLLAGEYTGADAINTLRAPYFFDAFNADKKIRFPKRGADSSFVIDIDDLVEDPDFTKREQAIEYPKKLNLQYQHANSGYAVVKATSSRSSPDARVVGEMSVSVPIVLDENQAAQTAAKMHKVAWAEADGELEVSMPDSFLKYTPTDVGSITLRGQTTRRRIEGFDYADGIIKWKMKKDRQSAYTSDVQGVPVPDPTPPPSTIVGETILAVMDIPSRIDTEDDLNIYYGVTGAMPAWYGAMVQRSIDAGANYTNVASIDRASIIGYITGTVADASEYYTDTTNTITVTLYRDGQELESISNGQFLSEGNPFALEKPDGSWEIMQYRDANQTSNGDFVLSTLHRGLLNSGTSSHSDGALLVMLERPTHVEMTSSLIGQSLTHRAPSFGQSQELATEQTDTYIGRSQIEWPVAYLDLERSGSNISATWTPRHRFGTDDNPVASINFQGYRVTIDGGSNGSVTFDTTTAGFTNYDATALGGGLTVSVSALNRITGAGPSTSGTI